MADVEASRVTASLYLAAALVMVPLGFIIDRYGTPFACRVGMIAMWR
jgi:hypothetical protein